MTRFFFGSVRVDGILDVDDITLPPAVKKEFDNKKTVHASYQFEIVVSVRGCRWQMHRRTALEQSAIFRKYDKLFPGESGKPAHSTVRRVLIFSRCSSTPARAPKLRDR